MSSIIKVVDVNNEEAKEEEPAEEIEEVKEKTTRRKTFRY